MACLSSAGTLIASRNMFYIYVARNLSIYLSEEIAAILGTKRRIFRLQGLTLKIPQLQEFSLKAIDVWFGVFRKRQSHHLKLANHAEAREH